MQPPLIEAAAMPAPNPFPFPDKPAPGLSRVRAYWEGLKRADNDMPFWDDVKLSALGDQADSALLIDAFEQPERFRFNTLGQGLAQRYGEPLAGKFLDESALRDPFGYLRAQASATVEARAPTYYEAGSVSRLLLPMWGEGHIGMLLGAVDWR
jgi:hypothetical protein